MHVGFVNVDGEKMSKSLGNFFTIRDVMKEFVPEVIRYFIVASHYRSPLNFSDKALKDAKLALSRFYHTLKGVPAETQPIETLDGDTAHLVSSSRQRFVAAMNDDFNTPEALSVLFELTRDINSAVNDGAMATAQVLAAHLKSLAGMLGLLTSDPVAFLQGEADKADGLSETQIEALIAARQAAKTNKDFAQADQIRKDLLAAGVVLEDSRAGTTWRRAE
jgi:cysteinyl-tRNA synthetase